MAPETTRLPSLLAVLVSLFAFAAAPAFAQLTIDFGSPPVTIVDGGAGDVCGATDEVCISGSLIFAGYTIVGPCTTIIDVNPLGARLWLSDCSVVKDAPAGPTVVPISFQSGVFPPLGTTNDNAVLDAIFTDVAPFSNVDVTLVASSNVGPIGTAGPLVPPPDVQSDFSPTTTSTGINQMFGDLTFNLDNVGDRVDLPTSAQVTAFLPPAVPSSSRVGTIALVMLVLGSAVLALRFRRSGANAS